MTATCEALAERQPFWREDDPVLDGERIVKGGMWPHQREWWRLPNFLKLLIGGYGAGKTRQLCKRASATTLHNGGIPSIVVSPTFPMARDTIVPTLAELLDGKATLRPGFRWHYHKTEWRFDIWDGRRRGTVLVRSGEHPERLKGSNAGCGYIDEPFIQELAVLQQLEARCRHPEARIREIGLAGTPEQLNWGADLVEGDLRNGRDVGFVRAPTRANLALPKSYVDQLTASMTDKMRAAYLEGLFVNLSEGLVYHAFDPGKHLRVEPEVPPHAEWGCGIDFNVNPMSAVVFWWTDERMHVVHEIHEANSDTVDLIATLRDLGYVDLGLQDVFPDPSGKARKTSSPAGATDFSHLRDAGFTVNAPSQAPPRRDRFNTVNRAFQRGQLTIDPCCPKLVRNLQGFTHELAHTPKHKAMGHILDALGYAVLRLFPIEGRGEVIERF